MNEKRNAELYENIILDFSSVSSLQLSALSPTTLEIGTKSARKKCWTFGSPDEMEWFHRYESRHEPITRTKIAMENNPVIVRTFLV